MIVEIMVRGNNRRANVEPAADIPAGLDAQRGGAFLRIDLPGETAIVRLTRLAGLEWWRLEVDRAAVPVRLHARDGTMLATVGAVRVPVDVRRWLPVRSKRSAPEGSQGRVEVRAPMPGLVTATPLTTGDSVQAGGVVAIVEAMKMQMEVPAPSAGRIEEVRVRPGQEVAGGQVLVILRPSGADSPGAVVP